MRMKPMPAASADSVLDPVEAAVGFWNCCANVGQLWWSRHGGVGAGNLAARRLPRLVRFAREASLLYRNLYAHLPNGDPALRELPTTTKARLMERFDDWSTDPRVKLADVERFLADRTRIGETYLGRYNVWKSSGTTGTPGIFLQDAHAMAVYDALLAAQFDAVALGEAAAGLWAGGGRAALVVATGDHFASITSWQHLTRGYPGMGRRSFSVLEPTAQLVEQLNDYQPAFLASYPSVLSLLAAERSAGRLRIAPALIWSGGEHLGEAARISIEEAFGCRIMNEYGASEGLSIAYGCREGWMHVNSEWVILEGVDREGRPTPPGELSHTTLLTNLANWIQPVIRYDLGDRVLASPEPCACGNPLPAIRVEGRTDAIVQMRTAHGAAVALAPLALSTVVEDAAGEHRFQIAQTAPDRLVVRFDAAGGKAARAAVWQRASRALASYLRTQSLPNVRVRLDASPPRLDATSGKLHAVTVELARIAASSKGARLRSPPR
jgi:phenylacetate-CoA ligase